MSTSAGPTPTRSQRAGMGMMASLSVGDQLVIGGAALGLIIGVLLLGDLLKGGLSSEGVFFAIFCGEALAITWLARGPAADTRWAIDPRLPTAAFVVAAFVLQLVLFVAAVGDLTSFTAMSTTPLVAEIVNWVAAVLMLVGSWRQWAAAR